MRSCSPTLRRLSRRYKNYVERMESLAPTLPDDPGNDKLIPQYRRFPRRVRQANLSRPAELYAVLEPFSRSQPAVVQKNWPGGKSQALAEEDSLETVRSRPRRSLRRSLARVRYNHDPEGPCDPRLSFTIASVATPAGSTSRTCS